MQNFWKRGRPRAAPPPATFASNAPAKVERAAANQGMIAPPPAAGFRVARYFTVASLAALLPVAAALLYFERRENDFFKQVQQEQNAFFAQVQDSFARQHDAAAHADLLRVHEAGNVNLTRLFANALWGKDFAPFVAKARRIPVDQCRAIGDVKDAGGKTVQAREKQACFAEVGKNIMAFPEFRALDVKVFDMMKKSTVFKIKVYDLRGITVYSSEHNQIGEDKLGNAGWNSAVAGKPASQLTHRDKFSAFEGAVENRDFIEIYLPVLAPGSDKIVAVFEVYSDVTQFLEQIKSTSFQIQKLSAENQAQVERAAAANWDKVDANTNQLRAIVLGLLALLYFALFLIVRHGQRIIDKQDFERKRAELALLRQKDLYDVLSQANKAMVRIVDRDELFATVCRVAVEHGRFRFAWIGLIDNDDQRLKPVARHGEDAGYIDQLDVSGDGASASRRGLTGRMLLSGTYVVSNDFLNDPERAPWCEAARRAGLRALAKFPIREGGAVVGAINLYAGEPGFFTKELVATLEETANDVSFALDNYARETARKQAVALLEKSEQRYRTIIQTAIDGFCIVDTEGRFLEVNDAYCRLIGYRREELMKMRIPDLDAIKTPEEIARHLRDILRKGYDHFVSRLRRKDGQLLDIEFSANLISDTDGERLFVFMRDITERKRAGQERRDYAERLRGLSRRLFAVEETERRNINRELHDRIGQSVSALNINLNIIRSQLPQESLDVVGARLQDTQTLLEGTAVQIRDIMTNLHPPALDDYGLLAALRAYAEFFGARVAVPITVHGEDLSPRLSLAAEMALFRIAQEALANAVKHARARNIEVALGATPERVTLTIYDDGVGFDAEHTMPAGSHWGLATMRERADAVGATLRIKSTPGRGVHVIVHVPRRAA